MKGKTALFNTNSGITVIPSQESGEFAQKHRSKDTTHLLNPSHSQNLNTQHLNNLRGIMSQQVIHPMVKFQRQAHSLVESQIIKPSDSIWKIALLYGDEWQFWKKELTEFGFSMQDPISEVLAVDAWDDE